MGTDRLHGWQEIAEYLGGVSISTAQRHEKNGGLPVYRLPAPGVKPPVFAIKAELDAWMDTNIPASRRKAMRGYEHTPTRTQMVAGPILDRISKLSNLTLYRRDYRLRFALRKSIDGVRCELECRYDVFNPTRERQRFVQEVTVDSPDHGYVEEMSFFTDGKPVYVLKRPRPTEKHIGYSTYRGQELLIEPSARGVSYECRASWVINRNEDDFWSTHMMLPTIGVAVETNAPPDFDITPSFSTSVLLMTAEHIDVAWSRRPRRGFEHA
jgi:hypothetical protein